MAMVQMPVYGPQQPFDLGRLMAARPQTPQIQYQQPTLAQVLLDGLGKLLWRFLWNIVTNSRQDSVLISPGELGSICCSILEGAVEVAGYGDRGNCDCGALGELLLNIIVLRFAVG